MTIMIKYTALLSIMWLTIMTASAYEISPRLKGDVNKIITLKEAGNTTSAIELARLTLKKLESSASSKPSDVAVCMGLLAWLQESAGESKEAESLYLRALAIKEKSLSKDHIDLVFILDELGRFYYQQSFSANEGGDLVEKAEMYFKRSLAIKSKQLGRDHLDVADSLFYLGMIYYSQGYSEKGVNDLDLLIKAEPLLKRALEIKEKHLGADHIDLTDILHTLGCIGKFREQYEKTVIYYGRALKIKEQVFGEGHIEVAQAASALGGAYVYLEKYEQAEVLIKRALKIKEKKLGLQHPELSQEFFYLIGIAIKRGQADFAKKIGNRMLAISEESESIPEELCSNLEEVGQVYHSHKLYQQAVPFFERSLEIRENFLGRDHPDLLNVVGSLSTMFYLQGEFAQAEPYAKQMFVIKTKELGEDHIEVAFWGNNLAWVYAQQQKYAQAEPLYKQALKVREKELGPNTAEVASILTNMAQMYRALGRDDEARLSKQRAELIQAILQ